MIYHVLPDLEKFSAFGGGALAHTVAHLMKLDPSRSVVCFSADDTWGFSNERIHVMAGGQKFAGIRGRRHFPPLITGPIFRSIYRPLLDMVKPGDIVWLHNSPGVGAALQKQLRRKGAKLIYHCHDAVDHRAFRLAFLAFKPDAYIFVSDYLRRYWTGVVPEIKKAYVIHNGASEELFYPSADGMKRENSVPVVLYVGRLIHDKGVHVLMQAMELLKQRGIPVVCKIVGSAFAGGAKPTPYVESLLATQPSNVEFIGFRSATEVADEFRAADILCVPSIWQEPFGKVNVEAMACALPVVATRVGGIPEIAQEGGIVLVEPDSAVELADALAGLLADPSARARLAHEAKEAFLRCFTWRRALEKYGQVVQELA
jgi:spore coat protein SA